MSPHLTFESFCCCSVAQLCLILCDTTDCSMPGFPVLHHFLELAQTPVHCWWYHTTILSSVVLFSSWLQSFLASGPFLMSWLSASIRWPKYWNFSFRISPSKEHSALISLKTDWFDLLTVQGTLKSLIQYYSSKASILWLSGFPSGLAGKESACNAGDTEYTGSVPGLGRSPGEGNGNPLQYSCLENPMDRGV